MWVSLYLIWKLHKNIQILFKHFFSEFFWIEHCEQYSIFMMFNISCRQKIKFCIHFDKSFTTHKNILGIIFPLNCYICYSMIYNVFPLNIFYPKFHTYKSVSKLFFFYHMHIKLGRNCCLKTEFTKRNSTCYVYLNFLFLSWLTIL